MRGYKIVMSTGAEVKIDQDEVAKVMGGIQRGGMIAVKQGLVNPSFIVSVLPDKDRVEKVYGDQSVAELPPLVNVFEGLKLQVASGMKRIEQ